MKLPWEKDPNDLEAAYRKPVPRSETIRLGAKFALVVAAAGWLWWRIGDRCEVNEVHDVCRPAGATSGANVLLVFGVLLVVFGAIDLFYLRRHEMELVFARNKRQQVVARIGVVVAGLLALGVAAGRLL